MGSFDHLIEKNLEPKADMDYYYLMDMMWEDGKLQSIDVRYGTIVCNVIKKENNSLEFSIKDDSTGKRYQSNYGWAFAENTPENFENIRTYLQAKEIFDAMRFHVDKMRERVIDLSPKKR